MKKVSLIVPVRNEEGAVGQLLDALLMQSYPFDEVVITDGGSTDNTRTVVESYASKDERIKLVAVEKASCGRGRNIAIENSFGDIVVLIDSGIIPECDWLEKIVSPMQADDNLACVFGHVIFETKSRIKPVTDLQKLLVFLTRPNEAQFCFYIPGSAIRRSVWQELKGFPEPEGAEDQPLIDIIERHYNYVYRDDAVCYYYDHPKSIWEIYEKWVFQTKCSTAVFSSAKKFYSRLMLFLLLVVTLMIFLVLSLKNTTYAYILVVLLSSMMLMRLGSRFRTHKAMGLELFKRPRNWLVLFFLYFVLDCARSIGMFKGLLEIFKKRVISN